MFGCENTSRQGLGVSISYLCEDGFHDPIIGEGFHRRPQSLNLVLHNTQQPQNSMAST